MAQKITTLTYLPLVETASLDPILAGVKKVDGVAQAYYGRRLEDNGILTLAVGKLNTILIYTGRTR